MPQDLPLFCISLALYALAALLFALGLTGDSDKKFRAGLILAIAGVLLHTVSLGLRWYFSGHMPGNNLYELNSVGGWLSVLVYLGFQARYPKVRSVGLIVLAITLGMMLYGVSKPHDIGPLSEEYQSRWFFLHIVSAFLAYSCYVVATSAAVLLILKHHLGMQKLFVGRLPEGDLLVEVNARFVAYGMVGHAVMLVSGSVWANTAWGRYWNWDPVETWSLITWLIYAFHLHARAFLHWNGLRLAWVSILALGAIVFTFWGVSHLPTGAVSGL